MSYEIRYSSDRKQPSSKDGTAIRIFLMSCAFFLLFLVFVDTFQPLSRTLLGNILFPGGAEPAIAAAETFVNELRNGAPIADSLEHFCHEIISCGNLP